MTQGSESGVKQVSSSEPGLVTESLFTEEELFMLRVRDEQRKAIEKYGELGQLPSGHPDYDIYDYAINELVGLYRYAEMVERRTSELCDKHEAIPGNARMHAAVVGARMKQASQEIGRDLIRLRQALRACGVDLGLVENRIR